MSTATKQIRRPIEQYIVGLISFEDLMRHYDREITVKFRERLLIRLARENTERRRRELVARMRREEA